MGLIGLGIAVGLAALGVGLGQGMAASAGLSGMARQPENSDNIRQGLLLSLVFPELVFLLTFVLGILMMVLGASIK
ncbi:MAG: ATP synthase F0 subunit C [Fimbriimonadaceae bacterium]|nr:ATP synthase F0 subunit C [Fimbriimonadaceae bacterium]